MDCGWSVGGLWLDCGRLWMVCGGLWMVCGWIVDSLWMDYGRFGMVCGWIVEDWSVKPLGELGVIGYAGCPVREEIA